MSRKPEDFKKLERIWYEKLRRSGFKDIENNHVRGKPLKQFEGSYFKARYSPLKFESQQQYFTMASQFLHEYQFQTEFERQVWGLHVEGMHLRQIAKIVKKRKKDTIGNMIKRLAFVMFKGGWRSDE